MLIGIYPAVRKPSVLVFKCKHAGKETLNSCWTGVSSCVQWKQQSGGGFLGAQPPRMIKCSGDSHSRLAASLLFLASALLVAVQLSSRVQTPAHGADIYNCHSCLHKRETTAQKPNDCLFLLAQDLSSFSFLPSSSPNCRSSLILIFKGGSWSILRRMLLLQRKGSSIWRCCFSDQTLRVLTQILLESLHDFVAPCTTPDRML